MLNTSLRKQLLITIIVMTLFVCVAIVWVSISAGNDAVNNLTQRIMLDNVERIKGENENYLNEALRAIEAVAPSSMEMGKKQAFPSNLDAIEQRIWYATSLYERTTSYIYFAGADASFVGIQRLGGEHFKLFLRHPNDTGRSEFEIRVAGERNHMVGTTNYDARLRPWYIKAIEHETPVWSDVYNDFTSKIPTITLAKSVYQPDHEFVGVVATDLSLNRISDFLRSLSISPHSVAYIIDNNGFMIASSGNEFPYHLIDKVPERKLAESMADPLIRDTYTDAVKGQVPTGNQPFSFSHPITINNEKVDVAVASVGQRFGLNWTTVVVVPRSDFMASITHTFVRSMTIITIFVVLALIIGLTVIERMLRDIRQLTSAALKIGNGEPLPRLHIHRKDEIGHLVRTFIEMENRLRFDRLTQVNNREYLMAQIDFLQRHAIEHPEENVNFTLLFLDLDRFKEINDTLGHSAGDQLLIVLAARLKAAVRDTDTVARFGGDEFVVLLNGTSNTIDIQATVDKIHALVQQPIALSQHTVSIRVSVGWSIFPTEALTYASLIEIADARMFSRKKEHQDSHLRLV